MGSRSKVGYVSGTGSISESGAGGKVEAIATSLDGKYDGRVGSVEGKLTTFSADAEGKINVLTGENGRYGIEGKAAA